MQLVGKPILKLKETENIKDELPSELRDEQKKETPGDKINSILENEKNVSLKHSEELLNIMHGTKKDQATLIGALIEQNNAILATLSDIANANGALVNLSGQSIDNLNRLAKQNEEKSNKIIQRIA